MSSCWKCGRDLPEDQTECEYGCKAADKRLSDFSQQAKNHLAESRPIDWDKVKSVDDLKLIFAACFEYAVFHPEVYPQLKKFLKGGE